ncbi:MAG: secretin N-terminal domain-containing protein [Candidatus Omnitrophota bacterium]
MKKVFVLAIIFFHLVGTVFCQPEDMEVKIFKIKNRRAESLLPVVEHMKSGEGKVTVDSNTDSLIVVDYPQNLTRMAEVLKTLDVPEKQVEIKVLVAEITDAFLGQAGLSFGQSVMTPERFDRMRYLLEKSENSNVRSEMTVLTMSGQPATIKVAQEEILWGAVVSVPESKTITVAPVAKRSAGKFLEVLPRVNNDGSITVTLRPEVSEFQKDRSIYERSIITQVNVGNGDTIAIGGLEAEKKYTEQTGIPLTGTRVHAGMKERRKIIMFLTATEK